MDHSWQTLFKDHSGEVTILTLTIIVVTTLFILVPQLIRSHLRKVEWKHLEHMKSLENNIPLPPDDERSRVAGRTALLVPMVGMITAATVTCFLVAYRSEYVFPVSLGTWVVVGVVSLAAITGGVALIGRLASIQKGELLEEEEDMPRYEP